MSLASQCNRRLFLAGMATTAANQAPLFASTFQGDKRGPVVLTDQGKKLHQGCLVADGHNDLPWALREKEDVTFGKYDLRKRQKNLQTDMIRLREGNVGLQFWSAYVPADTRAKKTALRSTLEQMDVVHRLVQTYPEHLAFARTSGDVERIRSQGKIASLIGLEGGHSMDQSLATLRMLHALGASYMTLTHSETIEWADSATDKPLHNGLTPFGEQVILEMNRLGMLVDISHVSPACMAQALRVTRSPLIFSHSSMRAIAEHPRNVPDDILRKLRDNGGVVMVNFYSGFVVPEAARLTTRMFEQARELRQRFPEDKAYREAMTQWRKENPVPTGSIHHVVDHLEHGIRVAGEDHVGLGSDFDGIPTVPKQLEDVSTYPLITQELLNRGHAESTIRKVLGANTLRVMREAEKAAAELAKNKVSG
jgi:membrane dipeptidase